MKAMKEYLLRIIAKDAQHPLSEQVLLDFGFPSDAPDAMVEALHATAELIRMKRTPEAAAIFLASTKLKNQILLGKAAP